jgi:hypothetical protein
LREERPLRVVSLFDWIERMRRFESESRFFISVILFFPSHSSSSALRVSRFSISLK